MTLCNVLIERVVAEVGAVFDVKFETADGAQAHAPAAAARRARTRPGSTLNFWFNAAAMAGPLKSCRCAFFKRFQREENDARVRRDAESADAQAGKRDGVCHAGLFQADVRHAADHRFGAVERRAVRQLRERDEILLVLRRHEAGRHFVETPAGQQNQPAINDQRDGAFAQHAADAAGIFFARPRRTRG